MFHDIYHAWNAVVRIEKQPEFALLKSLFSVCTEVTIVFDFLQYHRSVYGFILLSSKFDGNVCCAINIK
jgi:hypothetical protein